VKALILFAVALMLSHTAWALQPLPVTQLAPGFYLHQSEHHWPDRDNHGEIANIGFIIGDRCIAVIDSGGSPQQGLALRLAIKQISAKPVCYVINTHVHPDHIYGNLAFKDSGAHYVGHYKLPRAMAARGQFYINRADELLALHLTPEHIIPPDLVVKDSMNLNLGNREIVLTAHNSAHTDNDLSIYDPQTNTLWLADLFFREHIPVVDGSLKGWINELSKLEQRRFNWVIPGHGKPTQDWPAALQPQKQYLNLLASQIRDLLRRGKTLEQAVNEVGVSEKSHWALFDEFHRKNVTQAYAELEWED
jgi:quinoprotein relay system zinc metallohydrolase 2